MKSVSIRFPEELLEAIKRSAKRNLRSLNGEILTALLYYLKNSPQVHYDATPPGVKKEDEPTDR